MTDTNVKQREVTFSSDLYGFQKQDDPQPFNYDMEYKMRQSTNDAMSWLRLGWLEAYIPFDKLRHFNAVDVGAGNYSFVRTAANVFKRMVPYDLAGESITEKELYGTTWDLVVMSDVLEHFHNIDDFWKMHFRYAMVSFPESPGDMPIREWRHYKPDEHIYCLTQAKLSQWVIHNGAQLMACGCPEDMMRKRWDADIINISTILIKRS